MNGWFFIFYETLINNSFFFEQVINNSYFNEYHEFIIYDLFKNASMLIFFNNWAFIFYLHTTPTISSTRDVFDMHVVSLSPANSF